MFTKMTIVKLDYTFKPYSKDKRPNIDKQLVRDEIINKIMDYLFEKDNYFWNIDKYKKISNRDKLFNEQKKQWEKMKQENKNKKSVNIRKRSDIGKYCNINQIFEHSNDKSKIRFERNKREKRRNEKISFKYTRKTKGV